MSKVITVPWHNIENGEAMTGGRSVVMAALKRRGRVLWLRASGKATFYWLEGGKRRQRTWAQFRLRGEPMPTDAEMARLAALAGLRHGHV